MLTQKAINWPIISSYIELNTTSSVLVLITPHIGANYVQEIDRGHPCAKPLGRKEYLNPCRLFTTR